MDIADLDFRYIETDPPIIKQLKNDLRSREQKMLDTEDIFEYKTEIGIPISDKDYNEHEASIEHFIQDAYELKYQYRKYTLFSEMNEFFIKRNFIKEQLIILEQVLYDKLNTDVLSNIATKLSGIKGSISRQINYM